MPSHRLDVSIAADLLEDIARIHGYEEIPLTLINDVLPPQRSQPRARRPGADAGYFSRLWSHRNSLVWPDQSRQYQPGPG